MSVPEVETERKTKAKDEFGNQFIQSLIHLKNGVDKKGEDKKALAELRRELSFWPNCGPRALRIVSQFLPNDSHKQDTMLLTAVLFAHHPLNTHDPEFNMGRVMRESALAKGQGNSVADKLKSTEARFMRLLGAHEPEEIATHLRYAVQIAKSAEVPINWAQLYWDIRTLLSEDESNRNKVLRNWSRSFWSRKDNDESEHIAQDN